VLVDHAADPTDSVDLVNREQAEHWNSAQTRHWVDQDEHHDRMLRPFTVRLLDAAAVEPGERALDIGCGCGHTTRAVAAAAAPGQVLGVDLSAPMLDRARQLAEASGLDVDFVQADAQTHPFPAGAFDVAISRFGVMFFDDPVAAFANVRAGLAGGGRCLFVCWQPLADNPWVRVTVEAMRRHVEAPEPADPHAPGPFSLADPGRLRSILGEAGFGDVQVEPLHETLWLGDDTEQALDFLLHTGLARSFLDPAPPDAAARAVEATRAALDRHHGDGGVRVGSAAWLVRARRTGA
jgi:SAM-dependent methyltransferase